MWANLLLIAAMLTIGPWAAGAEVRNVEVPLVVGHRTIHIFREALGDISAEERAEAARHRIEKALGGAGEGWTSILPSAQGVIVALDGKPMLTVSSGDARKLTDETPESLANQASRILQKVWSESRERRDPHVNLLAILKVIVAFVILALTLALCIRISRSFRSWIDRRLFRQFSNLPSAGLGSHFFATLLKLSTGISTVLIWMVALLITIVFFSYSLSQFAVTRPMSETLLQSLKGALYSGLGSAAAAIPGLFVAVIIFMLARIATQTSRAIFDRVAVGRLRIGTLDEHTAPATRYLVNAAIWLFALAMSYPYLPGSHTEAFRGLSVLLGVMISIGASGLVGQIASGMILVFTRALRVGDYVRIQEFEGKVAHIGMFVTQLITGIGEEITLPNSLVIGQVTRNFSRGIERGGFLIDTTVTIGYDTPWRQVQAMLLDAARQVPLLRKDPAPLVVQSALSDFYVSYRLVAQVGNETAAVRLRVLSELNSAIQDVFNQYGVQIMSPHYMADPEKAKIVPESKWYEEPAAPLPERDP